MFIDDLRSKHNKHPLKYLEFDLSKDNEAYDYPKEPLTENFKISIQDLD